MYLIIVIMCLPGSLHSVYCSACLRLTQPLGTEVIHSRLGIVDRTDGEKTQSRMWLLNTCMK